MNTSGLPPRSKDMLLTTLALRQQVYECPEGAKASQKLCAEVGCGTDLSNWSQASSWWKNIQQVALKTSKVYVVLVLPRQKRMKKCMCLEIVVRLHILGDVQHSSGKDDWRPPVAKKTSWHTTLTKVHLHNYMRNRIPFSDLSDT